VKELASWSTYRQLAVSAQAFQEAVTLQAQGRLHEAAALYRAVLQTDARHFDAAYRLGLIQLQFGRFVEAESLFRRAVKIDRRSADAQLHLAVALTGLSRHDEAIRRYRKAIEVRANFAEAYNNLGYSLQALGRLNEAVAQYQRALALKPGYPEARNNLGTALAATDCHEEAIAQYRAAIELRPDYVEAHRGLADALGALEKYEQAAEHYQKVVALEPQDLQARTALANALHRLDRTEEAIAQYETVLRGAPNHAEANMSLGNTLHRLGQSYQALPHFERALAVSPRDPTAYSNLGNALAALGRISDANDVFERAIALAPDSGAHYWSLSGCRRFTNDDPHFGAMRALAEKIETLPSDDRIALEFALAKAFADVGERERSFQHLAAANALKRSQLDYDEAAALARLARVRAAFTPAVLQDRRHVGDPSAVPVFIIGMPRSGTTLIEQILASHPEVFGAGELREMGSLVAHIAGRKLEGFPERLLSAAGEDLRRIGADYVGAVMRKAPDATRITDKMPGNFIFAGLIHLVLPNARIIHACRDPRDTALSCFSLLFSEGLEFTYDLGELGRYYRAYHHLMAHWREVLPPGVMLDVQYEDLVRDLEGAARRIVTHCGLEWHDNCLDFHKTERSVLTASAAQVRRPIYESSIGRWRQYEDMLESLLRELPGNEVSNPSLDV
jgi:tetratricopeptide (TPR) repeat protein